MVEDVVEENLDSVEIEEASLIWLKISEFG